MRKVQLENVDVELRSAPCRHNEVLADPRHLLRAQLARDGAVGAVGERGRRHEPPPVLERDVHPDRPRPARSPPAGVAELERNGAGHGRPVVDRRRLGRDPALGGDRDEPAQDEPGPGRRRVGPHDRAVLKPQAPQREWSERRRRGHDRGGSREPGIERAREGRVADGEARVADAAASREQVEGELDRLQVAVARHPGEVGGALAGGLLRPLHDGLTLELVVDERSFDVPGAALERVLERDRVLHGELRARADREVGGVRGVAQEHRSAVVPDLVHDLREIEPERAVREQLVALEVAGEELLAEGEAVLLAQLVESGAAPRRLRALDDERARALVERVGVHLEEAVLGVAEDEGEGVEHEVGAEPDVLAALGLDGRAELALVGLAEEAVDAVGRDHEVGVVRLLVDLHAEREIDPEGEAAPLEDLQQALARDRREGVPLRAEDAAAVADVHPIPAGEGVRDGEIGLLVGVAERAERVLAEDDAPPERGVRRIPLEDGHVEVAVGLLEQDRQVEPGGAAADDRDPHPETASARRSSSATSPLVGRRTSSSQPASS